MLDKNKEKQKRRERKTWSGYHTRKTKTLKEKQNSDYKRKKQRDFEGEDW